MCPSRFSPVAEKVYFSTTVLEYLNNSKDMNCIFTLPVDNHANKSNNRNFTKVKSFCGRLSCLDQFLSCRLPQQQRTNFRTLANTLPVNKLLDLHEFACNSKCLSCFILVQHIFTFVSHTPSFNCLSFYFLAHRVACTVITLPSVLTLYLQG